MAPPAAAWICSAARCTVIAELWLGVTIRVETSLIIPAAIISARPYLPLLHFFFFFDTVPICIAREH